MNHIFYRMKKIYIAMMFLIFAFTGCNPTTDEPDVPNDCPHEADFMSFTFSGIDGVASIDLSAKTVTASAGSEVDLTKLSPVFTVTKGASVKVGSVKQESGKTENDFTKPVKYIVTCFDGSFNNEWTVNITKKPVGMMILTHAMINKPDAVLLQGEYRCTTSLTLVGGNHLTISEGVTIYFDLNTGIETSGNATFKAKGTATKPITFTSSQTDKQPGDWNGFLVSQSGSEFEYCIFEYGSGNSTWQKTGLLNVNNCKVSVKNCIFRNAKFSGISLDNFESGFTIFENNTITNCGEEQDNAYPMRVKGYLNFISKIGSGNNITTAKGIGVYTYLGNQSIINENTTLKAIVPYVFTKDPFIVGGEDRYLKGCVLSIEPGTLFKFDAAMSLHVQSDAKIIAKGTSNNRIVFTSNKAETDKATGQWGGLQIIGSEGCEFEYCTFEYGGNPYTMSSQLRAMFQFEECDVSIKNCAFRNSSYSGVFAKSNCDFEVFENNSIVNCGENIKDEYPIKLNVGIILLTKIGDSNTITTEKGIGVNGSTLDVSMTLKKLIPYYFYNNVIIKNVLTIEPGVILKFGSDRQLLISDAGKLVARGTENERITFTSEGAPQTGWRGIEFTNSVETGNVLEYGNVSYGSYNTFYGNITCTGTTSEQVTIKKCNITDSYAYGIYLNYGGKATLIDNTFGNNKHGNIFPAQ